MIATADELLGPGKQLSIEPGRALVATAGVTLYTVESVKDVDLPDGPVRFVAVDGGMSRQPAPDALRRAVRGRPRPTAWARTGTPCTVVGKHCESGDVLIRETTLPEPQPGRRARDARHRRLRVRDGQQLQRRPARRRSCSAQTASARLVVRRETFEDLYARDV